MLEGDSPSHLGVAAEVHTQSHAVRADSCCSLGVELSRSVGGQPSHQTTMPTPAVDRTCSTGAMIEASVADLVVMTHHQNRSSAHGAASLAPFEFAASPHIQQ